MSSTIPDQRRYDHRFQVLVQKTGDLNIALEQGVPRSTARGWLTRSQTDVVSLDVLDSETVKLQYEVVRLRRRVARLLSLLRLVALVVKLSGFSFARHRLPDGTEKSRLVRAVERSRDHFRLRTILLVLGLSPARYHNWVREQNCQLDDVPSCPKTTPQQLTPNEVGVIREMVTSEEYRHVPTGILAVLAQRLGKVFASASTWYRLVRQHKWRRPRKRVHPPKPKTGIRATKPNEIWHVDTTLIRLLDGSKAYLHAIIDNYSRRILAWRVADSFHPAITAQLLIDASKNTTTCMPTLMADGGVENFNSAVDAVIESGLLKRVLAQTDIQYSNSLIESWWRVLKHQWLYLNTLDSVSRVEKLVAFYVNQHNTLLPHSAFDGQTPDEMYFGTGTNIPAKLKTAKEAARQRRLATNRAQTCPTCQIQTCDN